jgi:hypothetical protein
MGRSCKLQWFYDNKFSFACRRSRRRWRTPWAHTPVGLLGWNAQLFLSDAMGDKALDDEFIVTNVAIYWLTNTGGSSIRYYYEDAQAKSSAEPTSVPIALATFAGDFGGIRRLPSGTTGSRAVAHLRRARRSLCRPPREPDALAADIRRFFAQFR